MKTKEEILKLAHDNDVAFTRLWFTDINGMLKSFAITSDELETALTDGMGFDGSSITGFQDIEESDMVAIPDTSTFALLPWRPKEKAVARMICDIVKPEMVSILAPWVNSYKRLVPGYEAPVYIAWSRRNRSALVRVPMYQPGKENATRMELRCPDPSGNPYLQLAVMLNAGLKGIEDKLDLEEPMELNLYDLNDRERAEKGIISLPYNLGEAIRQTEKSELMKEALGDHCFERFIALKKKEWDEYRIQVTDYEIKKYYPIL